MTSDTRRALLDEINRLDVLDAHSHMAPSQLHAARPSNVLLYHMLLYPLRAAGMRTPGHAKDLSEEDEVKLLREAVRYFPAASNTAFFALLRRILRDLYGMQEELTETSLDTFLERFVERSTAEGAARLLRQIHLVRSVSMSAPLEAKGDALIDVGRELPINTNVESPEREAALVEQVRQAGGANPTESLKLWASALFDARGDITSLVCLGAWISSWVDYRKPTPEELRPVFDRAKGDLTPDETSFIASARTHAVLEEMQRRGGRVMQIIYGCQQLPAAGAASTLFRPLGRARDTMPNSLAWLAGGYPDIHFIILPGHDAKAQELNTLPLAYPNVTIAGMWWHNFYPEILRREWRLRLEMVPAGRLIAFISDGYCADWCYARLVETREAIAEVLADMVDDGRFGLAKAVDIARTLLYESAHRIYYG